MAFKFNSLSSGDVFRSASSLNPSLSFTIFGWGRQGSTTPSAGKFRTYYDLNDNGGSGAYIYVGSTPVSNNIVLETSPDNVTTFDTATFTPTANTWFWWAVTYNSSTHVLTFIVNNSIIGTITQDLSTYSFVNPFDLIAGTGPNDWNDLSTSYSRTWQQILTVPQLLAESASQFAVVNTNKKSDNPLVSLVDSSDVSGNGNDFTEFGTCLYIDGPLHSLVGHYEFAYGITEAFTPGMYVHFPLLCIGKSASAGATPPGTMQQGFQVWFDALGTTFPPGTGVAFYASYTNNPTPSSHGYNETSHLAVLDDSGNGPPHTIEITGATSSIYTDYIIGNDGWFQVKLDGTVVFNVTGLTTNPFSFGIANQNQWTFASACAIRFASSIYLSTISGFCPSYGQVYPPFTVPPSGYPSHSLPAVCGFSAGPNVLFNENFIGKVDSDVFADAGGFWTRNFGQPVLSNGWLYDVGAGANAFESIFHTSLNPQLISPGPPPGTGTIIVNKITVPNGSLQSFSISAMGPGLSNFSINSGGSQVFNSITPGSGYSVVETLVPGWTTSYSVSNGSPNTNLSVGNNETVTVTITNIFNTPTSGIYFIHPGKTDDTYFINDTDVTEVVKIPDPFGELYLHGEES